MADALLERATRCASLELQRSGFVPSAAEALAINEITTELQSEVPKLDAEIRRLSQLRAQVLQQRDVQKSIVSPVRRLPPESLSDIFIELVDEKIWAGDAVFIVRHVLSCVCASWRAVARSTPALWQRIPTQLHSEAMTPEWKDYAKHAAESAVLAGGLPLEIHHQDDTRDAPFLDVVEELAPHLPRVESISVQGRFSLFEALRRTSLPALRDVFMEMRGQITTHPMHFLTGSPALRSLDVQYFNDDDRLLDLLQLPALPSLADLSLEIHATIPRARLLVSLGACADTLVELHLRLSLTDALMLNDDALALTRLVHFHALRTLSFGESAHRILVAIAAPALRHIGLHAVSECFDGDPFPLLEAFLSRPSAPRGLESLTLAVSVDQTASFLRCLAQMEALTHLAIHSFAFTGLAHESVFARLTCADDEPPLLPRLTSFETSLPPPDRRSPRAERTLQEMIASRSMPRICASREVSALEKVEIKSLDGIEKNESDESESEY
ncbi:hypothetical protein K523DRAFT_299861 [Schizophyllum commune Tattone D]|nr:hypothetical protein K523DRAFT_299861 [Schizophyllum commune Tattone D]